MRYAQLIAVTTALVVLLAVGCSSQEGASTSPGSLSTSADSSRSSKGAGTGDQSGQPDLPQGNEPVNLDPRNFTTKIDNRYWPMVPGSRWVYRETDTEGAEQSVVVTVTEQTKKIANGITARVVRDTVTDKNGKIIEDTFDWYAQDEQGNIWYLGEDTAEFDNGEITSKSGSFEAGIDGAVPGIIMPANPQDGMQYRQEYYKGEAEDNGEILSTQEMVETPYAQFGEALLTKDTTIEPNVLEYKLYAPRVGPVLTLGVFGGPGSREELVKLDNAPEEVNKMAGTAPLGEGPISPSSQ